MARVAITFIVAFFFTVCMVFLYSYVVNKNDNSEELELQACQSAEDPMACLRQLEIVRGCDRYASDDDEYVECITSTSD